MPRNRLTTAFPFALLAFDPFCYSDSGGADSTGGGSSSPGAATSSTTPASGAATHTSNGNGAATPTVDFSQFTAGLERLGETLGTRLDALRGDVGQLPDHLRPPPQEPPPPDFDAMTQAELAQHITGSVGKLVQAAIAEALAPLTQQIQHVQQTQTTSAVTADIAALRAERKDFSDWKDEMVALAKQHPTLGVRQLYGLARTENPAKAGELDNRYNPPPPPPPKWGGLLPTARGNGSTPPLSKEQATQEAYREVAARHPGVLTALENL